MKNCIFCKIIKGKEPARIVYEDKDVKLDTWPKLPPYVNFTGKVAGDALGENFSYDTKTGEFSYFISSLPANLGYTEKEIDLAFQIVVLSPANLDPRYLELIPSFGYKVTSVFTNTNFTGSTQSINASEIIYELK
jgi:hypothetical protein